MKALTQDLPLVMGRDCDCCAWCENEHYLNGRVGHNILLFSAFFGLAWMLVIHCY